MSRRFAKPAYEWFDIADAASYRTDDGLHLTRSSGRRLAAVLRAFIAGGAPSLKKKNAKT